MEAEHVVSPVSNTWALFAVGAVVSRLCKALCELCSWEVADV